MRRRHAAGAPENRSSWPSALVSSERLPAAIDAVDIGEGGGAVEAELIERAGRGERLERALVDAGAD